MRVPEEAKHGASAPEPAHRRITVDGEGEALARITELALFGFALVLRIPTLGLRRIVEGDGVHYAQLARAILAGDFSGLANPYWSNLWPAVIAGLSSITGLDVVSSGRALSLLAGSLLAVVTARLAARCFGRTAGVAAGLLVAGHPWLIHFSTLVFTESFFSLLLETLLFLAPWALRSRKGALATGLAAGLAIVTRPEGYAAAALVLAWLVLLDRPRRAQAASRVLFYVCAIALCVACRAGAVHHYFGLWDLGGLKGTANLLVGMAETDGARERLATELTASGEDRLSREASETTLVGFALAHPGPFASHMMLNGGRLLVATLHVLGPLPPVSSWIEQGRTGPTGQRVAVWTLAAGGLALAAVGVWAGVRVKRTRATVLLLASVATAYWLGLGPLIVHDRLVMAVIPILLIFVAGAMIHAVHWATGGWREQRGARALASLLVVWGAVSLGTLLHAGRLEYSGDPVVQREAGLWLAAHHSQDERIMTAAPAVGFYFYDAAHQENERSLPWADCAGVVARAREWGVRLLVIPDWHLTAVGHPAAEALLHPEAPVDGLRHEVTLGEAETGRIVIYDVCAPQGSEASAR